MKILREEVFKFPELVGVLNKVASVLYHKLIFAVTAAVPFIAPAVYAPVRSQTPWRCRDRHETIPRHDDDVKGCIICVRAWVGKKQQAGQECTWVITNTSYPYATREIPAQRKNHGAHDVSYTNADRHVVVILGATGDGRGNKLQNTV